MKKRRQFSPEYKAKAALEAIKGQRTLSEVSAVYPGSPPPKQMSL